MRGEEERAELGALLRLCVHMGVYEGAVYKAQSTSRRLWHLISAASSVICIYFYMRVVLFSLRGAFHSLVAAVPAL